MISGWPGPSGQDEFALAFDRTRTKRLLIIPPLFEEANKTRHMLVEVMRRLDISGIDCFLPDLPGCNESLRALETQSLESWRNCAITCAEHFKATHVLAVRGGSVLAPARLPGWRYAPISGAAALKSLLRARTISAREAGTEEASAALLELGRHSGLDLAGYRIGAAMIRELEIAHLPDSGIQVDIEHKTVGGAAPWLRAEPGYDPAQSDALAAIVAVGMGS